MNSIKELPDDPRIPAIAVIREQGLPPRFRHWAVRSLPPSQ